jgi:signal transduction histidine kinase
MQESPCASIVNCVGFGEEDEVNLRALQPHIAPAIPAIVDRFCDDLLADPNTRVLFTDGEEQSGRLRRILSIWMAELFQGTYGEEYFERRLQVGAAHARASVPQQHMVCGMETIRQELERRIRQIDVPQVEQKLSSLRKLLTIEMAITLEGYKESYSAGIRESERSAVEEKLTRAQHLAKIGQLAASLAHEIKNPLAGISGAIQIIRETMPPDDPHQPIISEILGQIDRLDATVKDLLLYARPTPPQRTEFPLSTIVSRVLNVLREEPELQRVHVECSDLRGNTHICADDRQIEQLIINLILNAAQASPDGKAIELAINGEPEKVTLVIKDEGRGMTPEVRRQAFEPFFTTKSKGTGLGLSICRRIAEAHGGEMQLESEVAQGTTVTVSLPRQSESASEGEQP